MVESFFNQLIRNESQKNVLLQKHYVSVNCSINIRFEFEKLPSVLAKGIPKEESCQISIRSSSTKKEYFVSVDLRQRFSKITLTYSAHSFFYPFCGCGVCKDKEISKSSHVMSNNSRKYSAANEDKLQIEKPKPK